MTEVFMGNSKQYTDEFRAEAVKQVIERGFTVVDVASRIGIPTHTLYGWVQAARKATPASGAAAAPTDSAEIRRHGSAGGLSPVEFERRYAQSGD